MTQNCCFFIPALTIPALMTENCRISEFYVPYNYYRHQPSTLFDREYRIEYCGNALIDVVIRPSIEKCEALKKENNEIPFIAMTAMIDTGASISAIREQKANKLNVERLKGPSIAGLNLAPQEMTTALMSIHIQNIFPDTGFLDIRPVILSEWESTRPYDFVIGWDVLRFCNLSYKGTENEFALQFIEQ